MTRKAHVRVSGYPVAKGRGRAVNTPNGPRVYTPGKTARFEQDVRQVARLVMDGENPMSRPVRVYMEATYPPSSSWPKWKQDAALKGALKHTGKPDADNLVKSVQDGLNGIVFIDDAQIFDLRVVKQYGEAPAVDVWVEEISQPERASDWKVDNRSQ